MRNCNLTRIMSNKKLPEPPPLPNRNKPLLLRISLNLDRRPFDFLGASVVLEVSSKIQRVIDKVAISIVKRMKEMQSYQQKRIK